MNQEENSKIKLLEKDAFIIKESNDLCAPWDSKLGGKAYLLESDEYPISIISNEPLDFLIQINLRDLVENAYFPKNGLLQFFINIDYSYEQDDLPFLVKYIDKVTYDEDKIDFDLDDDYDDDDDYIIIEDEKIDFNNMIQEEIKIYFEKVKDKINPTALEWEQYRHENKIMHEFSVEELKDILDEDSFEITKSSKLLGYPDNYEDDIRLDNPNLVEYILLLQLHPSGDYLIREEEQSICWFIHPDDLKNLDFSRVICSFFDVKTF